MKKLVLLLCLAVAVGCSKHDDEPSMEEISWEYILKMAPKEVIDHPYNYCFYANYVTYLPYTYEYSVNNIQYTYEYRVLVYESCYTNVFVLADVKECYLWIPEREEIIDVYPDLYVMLLEAGLW